MSQTSWIFSKFSQNYRQLSAIYFYCFTHFVEQFLADFLLLFFAPAVAPCAKSSFYRENILFDHVASLCPGKTAGSRSVRTICAYVAGRRNMLAKVFCAFSHTRTIAKTRNAFSLLSALFEQYAHIASGFATTPSCRVRAFVHYARERSCTRFSAPTRCGAAAFALQKMRRTFLFPKLKKRARPLYFVKKASICRFFRRHGVFSGTAFCRRNEIRPSFRVFYRQLRISIRARRRKRLYLPLFRAFPCASFLSLSIIVFRKIGTDFAL